MNQIAVTTANARLRPTVRIYDHAMPTKPAYPETQPAAGKIKPKGKRPPTTATADRPELLRESSVLYAVWKQTSRGKLLVNDLVLVFAATSEEQAKTQFRAFVQDRPKSDTFVLYKLSEVMRTDPFRQYGMND